MYGKKMCDVIANYGKRKIQIRINLEYNIISRKWINDEINKQEISRNNHTSRCNF